MGERSILEWIDWEENGDPYFYENHHLSRVPIAGRRRRAARRSVYDNTTKFSGKKLVVHPGCSYVTRDRGVHNLLVWREAGTYGGAEVQGGDPDRDELVVTHDRAARGVEVRNTGREDLLVIKFFGPDVNTDVPIIGRALTCT